MNESKVFFMNFEKLYTVDDIAKFTNLSTRTIRNYLKDGILKGKKIGGQWRFSMEDINKFINEQDAIKEIRNIDNENLMDFINGVNTDFSGELQICTIVDYYSTENIASNLSNKFSNLVSNLIEEQNHGKFSYYYFNEEQKARYTFFGPPNFIIEAMKILKELWEEINSNKNIFSSKEKDFLKGRPDYPKEFIDYLYNEFSIDKNKVIADIGSGTGKLSKCFLERANKVFCVEPNKDMIKISNECLNHYKYYVPLDKSAEDTKIESNSIDFIVCGNSYDYFDRSLAIPEFKRILKPSGKVIISYYAPFNDLYSSEMEILSKYFINPTMNRNYSNQFKDGEYIEKEFYHEFYEGIEEFLSGCLSHSLAPKHTDENYELYKRGLEDIFNKYKINDKIKVKFRLKCFTGNVESLIY